MHRLSSHLPTYLPTCNRSPSPSIYTPVLLYYRPPDLKIVVLQPDRPYLPTYPPTYLHTYLPTYLQSVPQAFNIHHPVLLYYRSPDLKYVIQPIKRCQGPANHSEDEGHDDEVVGLRWEGVGAEERMMMMMMMTHGWWWWWFVTHDTHGIKKSRPVRVVCVCRHERWWLIYRCEQK